MEIRHVRKGEVGLVADAGGLFDHVPDPRWTEDFLGRGGNHLLIAFVDDRPVGFVSGIEILHPDKGPEMLLYELAVDAKYRGRAIGKGLVERLRDVARDAGCRGMWVVTSTENEIAKRTYRAAGAGSGETTNIMEWVFDSRIAAE